MTTAPASEDILHGVLDQWKSAVDAHEPGRVASCFTEDAILGYLSVDFGFTDGRVLTVNLTVIVQRAAGNWRIRHYHVSRAA
jgi:hypothetical protein